MFAPMMPHLAEECWAALGHHDLVAVHPWPHADASLAAEDMLCIPVQVNGRKRAELFVPRDASPASIEGAALEHESVVRAMEGRPLKRIVVVPQRVINVVV